MLKGIEVRVNKWYYRLRDLCISNYLVSYRFNDYILEHKFEALIQNNVFKYGSDFYVNIQTFYKLALIHNEFHVFKGLINNLDDISILFTNVGNPVYFGDGIYYVYIFNCFTKLKIGFSSNIITRLKTISNDTKGAAECVAMFEYDSRKDAYLVEQMLLNKFKKYIIKGEYLTNSPNIVDEAKKVLNTRLVPIFEYV